MMIDVSATHEEPLLRSPPGRVRPWPLTAGIVLAVLGLLGVVHGGCAAVAQGLYHQAKYGAARDNPRGIARRCAAAQRLYPWNYYFCTWAASRMYEARNGRDAAYKADCLRIAGHWCNRAVALNPYLSEARFLQANLLRETSPAAAAATWEAYVDWNYWNPQHHLFLLELQVDAGQFEKALKSLAMTRDTPWHARARRLFQQAWIREMKPPDLPAPPPAAPQP